MVQIICGEAGVLNTLQLDLRAILPLLPAPSPTYLLARLTDVALTSRA